MNRRATMELLAVCLLLFLALSSGVGGIKVLTKHQLVAVENGTKPYVVLDCPYSLTEDNEQGVVLKWFINNSEVQEYQWIPNGPILTPQTTLPDHVLDASYEHSTDPYHKYRALKLLNPTTHLSGDYTCDVSSYENEDTLHVTLIVYVLPEEMTLSVEQVSGGNYSVMCISQPTYPEPSVMLYIEVGGTREAIQADSETVYDNDTYNTTLSIELPPEKLAPYGDVSIVCRLSIPNSNISLEESLHLGPEVEDEVVVVADASTHSAVAVTGVGTAPSPYPFLHLLVVAGIWNLRSSSGSSL